MSDRLLEMEVFVRVADRGSFAAAADVLGLSAQMVGRHIRSLEDRLGVRLINRSTRRQSLTEEGTTFLDGCRLALSEVEAAEAGAAESRAIPVGRLRVDAPVTFGNRCLAPALPIYLRANPSVTVELTLNNRKVDLIEEGYDAVIRVGALIDSGLAARKLAPYRFVVCASPGYVVEHGVPTSVHELGRHDCLAFTRGVERAVWTFESPDGRQVEHRVSGRFAANDGEALRSTALAGLGIVMQPEMLLRADLDVGRLVEVLPDHQAPALPLYLLFVAGRQLTPKLRSFIDFMVEQFGSD